MSASLKPEIEKFIDDQVRSGRFSSRSEALEAGVARLMLDPEPDVVAPDERAALAESIEQMRRGEVIDAKDLHAELRKRYLDR